MACGKVLLDLKGSIFVLLSVVLASVGAFVILHSQIRVTLEDAVDLAARMHNVEALFASFLAVGVVFMIVGFILFCIPLCYDRKIVPALYKNVTPLVLVSTVLIVMAFSLVLIATGVIIEFLQMDPGDLIAHDHYIDIGQDIGIGFVVFGAGIGAYGIYRLVKYSKDPLVNHPQQKVATLPPDIGLTEVLVPEDKDVTEMT